MHPNEIVNNADEIVKNNNKIAEAQATIGFLLAQQEFELARRNSRAYRAPDRSVPYLPNYDRLIRDGLRQGATNLITAPWRIGKETVLIVVDVGNDTVAVVTSEGVGYKGHLSQTGQALDNGSLTAGQFYKEAALNGITLGTYGQYQTMNRYLAGEITADEASKALIDSGLGQLLTARLMTRARPYRAPRTLSRPAGYTRMQDHIPDLGTLPANARLTPQQAFALQENLQAIVAETVPGVRASIARGNVNAWQSLQNQLNLPRFRFIDQVPGGRAMIDSILQEFPNLTFPH